MAAATATRLMCSNMYWRRAHVNWKARIYQRCRTILLDRERKVNVSNRHVPSVASMAKYLGVIDASSVSVIHVRFADRNSTCTSKCISMYQYVSICINMCVYQYVFMCISMYQYVSICIYVYQYVLMCINMYLCVSIICIYQYVSIYQYV